MIVGDLELRLRADIARLQRDMDSARRVVDDATTRMGRAANTAKMAFGAIAGVLSVAAFGSWVKGAIDAADAASKLSAKTGVAVKDLAGIQLAYDLGGAGGDAFASSMSKLSKAITEGNSGLAALGIKTVGVSGALISNKDVLYQVADAFAGMDDGARKTSMAMEIFGKTGADLIPLLNGGAEGFRQMDEMANKLGLTMSDSTAKSAEAFNDNLDLLMMGSQGVARGIAAELLPTLSSLSGAFLESMTSGDRLKNVAEFLGTALKVLFTVAVGIVEVFNTVGKTIGAAGAQIVAILSGDFKMAAQIGREWSKDIGDSWTDTAKTISAAWSGEGAAAVEAQAKIMKAQKDLLAEQKAREEAAKKAAQERTAAAKKSQQEYESAVKAGNDFIASMKVEGAQLGMNAAQIKEMAAARNAAKAPTAALRAQILSEAAALSEATQAWALKDAAEKSAAAVDAELYASLAKTTGSIDDQIAAMRKQIDAYGLTEVAVIDLAVAKAEAALAAGPASYAELFALDAQISKLKELRSLAATKGDLEVAKKATDENLASQVKMWESVESTAHDTFVSIFDSGKSAFDRLRDTLKNGLMDLLYQMTVKKWIFNIGASVGMTGMTGAAQAAAGAGGGVTGTASNLMSMYTGGTALAGGMAGSMGTGFVGSVYGGMTGAGVGSGLTSSAGLAIGQGLGAAGSALMAAAPYLIAVAAAIAVWKKLDTSGTYHTGGASSASAAGVNSVRAESLNFEATRVNAETEKMTAALASGIVGILDSTATAFGKTAGYTAATAFADDTSKDGAWGGLMISKLGEKILDWQDTKTGNWAPKVFADGDAGKAEYLAALSASVRTALDGIGLPAWAQTMLDSLGTGASIEEMAKVIDSINATQRALVVMGEKLTGFAGLSEAATSALITASGGIEALAASASSYYDTYYKEAEKTADITKQVTDALAAVGLAMPASQAAFRAQVEAQMALGEAGAPAVAALLKVNQAFAQLNPVMDEVADSAQNAADLMSKLKAIHQEQRGLDIQLMTAMGDAEGALAATRSDALAGLLSDQARVTQAQIWAAEASTAAIDKLKAAAADMLDQLKTAANTSMAVLVKAVNDAKLVSKSAFDGQIAILNAQKSAAATAFGSQIAAGEASVRTATEANSKIASLAGSLKSTLDGMRLSATAATDRISAQAQISAALAIARSTGKLPNADALADALKTVAQPQEEMFSSYADFARDYYRTAGQIADLSAITGTKLTASDKAVLMAQSQLDATKALAQSAAAGFDDQIKLAQAAYDLQIGQFDQTIAFAQQQLDAMNGTQVATMDMVAALGAFNGNVLAAIGAAKAANPAAAAPQPATGDQISDMYRTILGRDPDAGGLAFWNASAAAGESAASIANSFYNSPEYLQLNDGRANGIDSAPRMPPTTVAQGVRGGGADNSDLLTELRLLRTTVEKQQRTLDKIETGTSSTAGTLDNAAKGGRPLGTVAA